MGHYSGISIFEPRGKTEIGSNNRRVGEIGGKNSVWPGPFYASPAKANCVYTACEQHCRFKGLLIDDDHHRLDHLAKSGRPNRSLIYCHTAERSQAWERFGGGLREVGRSTKARDKESRFNGFALRNCNLLRIISLLSAVIKHQNYSKISSRISVSVYST